MSSSGNQISVTAIHPHNQHNAISISVVAAVAIITIIIVVIVVIAVFAVTVTTISLFDQQHVSIHKAPRSRGKCTRCTDAVRIKEYVFVCLIFA